MTPFLNTKCQHIYLHTSDDRTKLNTPIQPTKTPYLVIEIEHAILVEYPRLKQLENWGSKFTDQGRKINGYVITSHNKVIAAIKIIENLFFENELPAEIQTFLDKLNKPARQYKASEAGREKIGFFDLSESDKWHQAAASSPHSMLKANDGTFWSVKRVPWDISSDWPKARSHFDLEAFSNAISLDLLGSLCQKGFTVYSQDGKRFGFASAYFNGRSLLQFLETGEELSDTQRLELLKIALMSYLLADSDLNNNNVLIGDNGNVCRIDTADSFWPEIVHKFRGGTRDSIANEGRATGIPVKDTFPLTARDITDFPFITDAKPTSFLDSDKAEIFPINYNFQEDVIREKFILLVKFAVLNKDYYQQLAKQTLTNEKLIEKVVNYMTERSLQVRKLLVNDRDFQDLIVNNPRFIESITELQLELEELITEAKQKHANRPPIPSQVLASLVSTIGSNADFLVISLICLTELISPMCIEWWAVQQSSQRL